MTDVANNVVAFPKKKSSGKKDPPKLEDIQHNVEMMRHYHIQETILNLTPIIFNQLDIAGFGLSDDDDYDDIKDGAFVVEALRSMMCKHYGIYHPFQQIAEHVFKEEEINDEGVFKIVDHLDIQLKKDSNEEK